MFGSALTKYYVTLLLIGCCHHHISTTATSAEEAAGCGAVSQYLNSLAAACLLSAAQCKVHKQEHRSGRSNSKSLCDGSENVFQLTVAQLLSLDTSALCRRCDEMCGGRSLIVKLKSAALLDQLEE